MAMLCCGVSLWGEIGSLPADSRILLMPGMEDRDYHLRYHQDRDDLHWYNTATTKWAVKYDIGAIYTGITNPRFRSNRAFIFFPVTGDSATVEIFADQAGQPVNAQPLARTRVLVDQNYMDIALGSFIEEQVFWLVLTYQTGYAGPYVSASIGGGSNSYYYNTNAPNPYYQMMSTAGFNCEFAFGMIGEFILPNVDLQLMEIGLSGNLAPRERVYPVFSIYNHSDTAISGLSVNFVFSTPQTPTGNIDLQIPLSQSLAPRQLYTYDASAPNASEHMFTLPDEYTQFRIGATVSPANENDPTGNNNLGRYMEYFPSPYPIHLAETFLRYHQRYQILTLQDQYSVAEVLPIYYYPIVGDTLGNIGASQRFAWYAYNSMPRTVVDGNGLLVGSSSSYVSQYQENISLALQNRSFVSEYNCRLTIPEDSELINAEITLSNPQTRLYTSLTDLNYISGSRLYVGLFKKIRMLEQDRYVFERWISYQDTINTAFSLGTTITKNYTLFLQNLDVSDLVQNYCVIYWLQHSASKRILFSAQAFFDPTTSVEDDISAPLRVAIFPNPFRAQVLPRIELSALGKSTQVLLSIYNLRGALTWQHEYDKVSADKISIQPPDDVFRASGMYFLRVSYRDEKGKSRQIIKKISFIK